MIIVVTCVLKNESTGKDEIITSHGIEQSSGKQIVLPSEHPKDLGAYFDETLKSWVLRQ